jgi:predicted ester cyclase
VSDWLSASSYTASVVEYMVAENDKVAARWTTPATHRDEFIGIPPTSNEIRATWYGILCLSGGKIVESWDRFNVLEMVRQLRRSR